MQTAITHAPRALSASTAPVPVHPMIARVEAASAAVREQYAAIARSCERAPDCLEAGEYLQSPRYPATAKQVAFLRRAGFDTDVFTQLGVFLLEKYEASALVGAVIERDRATRERDEAYYADEEAERWRAYEAEEAEKSDPDYRDKWHDYNARAAFYE